MKNGICSKCGFDEIVESVPADYAHGDREVPRSVTANPRWMLDGRNPRDVAYGKMPWLNGV